MEGKYHIIGHDFRKTEDGDRIVIIVAEVGSDFMLTRNAEPREILLTPNETCGLISNLATRVGLAVCEK